MAGIDIQENPSVSPVGATGSFEEIITLFRESNDLSLRAKAYVLEDLQKSFNSSNIAQAEAVLAKMKSPEGVYDYEKINTYINELQAIIQVRETEQIAIVEETKKRETVEKDSSGWVDSMINTGRNLAFGTESLARIKDIEINASVQSPEEFLAKIEKLIATIQRTPEFKSLTENEQKNIIAELKKLSQNIKKGQETQLDFLNTRIDSLASQVESQEEGTQIKVTIEGGDIFFPSKEKAFAFIENLKSEAESEFQSFWVNASELIGDTLWSGLDWGTWIFWGPQAETLSLSHDIDNWDSGSNVINGFLFVIPTFLAIAASVNYSETIFRRVIVDNIAKLGVNEIKFGERTIPFLRETTKSTDKDGKTVKNTHAKRLRIPDYDISGKDFFGSPEEVALRNEYLQRIQAVRRLEESLRSLTGQEKELFAKELEKVKGYLNINTDTFWLKAWSLDKDHWFPRRGWNAISNGPGIFGRNLRQIATGYFNLDEAARKDMKSGLQYAFDGKFEISIDDKTQKLTIEGDTQESKNIKDFKNFILSQGNISSAEKERRIKRIDDFLESLKHAPAGEDYIKRELVNIAEEGYLSKADIQAAIEKKLFEKYPFLEKYRSTKGRKASWAEKIEVWKIGIKEFLGKNVVPASLTSDDTMLFRFAQFVENEGWEGNREHLKDVFDKIDSGKLEFSQIYAGRKLAFLRDFTTGFFNRYGLATPEVTELRRYADEVSEIKVKNILDIGKGVSDIQSKIKKYISSGLEFDGQRRNPIQALRNYIGFMVSDSEEVRLSENLDTFLKDIEEGKVLYSEKEFFRELQRIQKGFVPSYKLLDEFDKLKKKEAITLSEIENIDKFVQVAREGKLDFNKGNIEELKGGRLTFDATENYIGGEFSEDMKKDYIRELGSIERLSDYNFRESLKGMNSGEGFNNTKVADALIETYKQELELSKVIATIEGRTPSIENELRAFAPELKHNYTYGQANKVLQRIFAGESFSSIKVDLQSIVSDITLEPSTRFEAKPGLITVLITKFESITDPAARERILNYIKDNNINDAVLPEVIKKSLQEREGRGEKTALIERNKSTLQGFIDDIDRANTPKKLEDIEKRFNDYITNPVNNINRANPLYKDLIENFQDVHSSKEASISPTVAPGAGSTPREEVKKVGGEQTPENKEFSYKQAKAFLDEIYPSVALLDKKTQGLLDQEYVRINSDSSYVKLLGEQADLLGYYQRTVFQGKEIFSLKQLGSAAHIRGILSGIDKKFAGTRTYSQLGEMIQATHDVKLKSSILRAIKKIQLTR